MTSRPIRGTKDLLPREYKLFQKIVDVTSKVASRYAFEDFYTPIMEYTEVFQRSLGDTSDVVSKEMYSFTDKGGDSLTLRPEFTAGIMRAVISNSLTHNLPLRLFSYGPLFRHERPQAGRQRQFHQINCEILGDSTYLSDVEIIKLANDILKELDLLTATTLNLNSLGCQESRENFHIKLKEYLFKYENELSEDSKKRLHKNPMRILDSKDENDQKIVESAPNISEGYTKESAERFEKIQLLLKDLRINYVINPKLVRGLDYYCHTAFEFINTNLGAQSTLIGGGRYDGLSKIMSKHDFPGIGFAGGIERMMMLLDSSFKYTKRNLAILPIGDGIENEAYILADKFRSKNIPTTFFSSGKLGKRIEKACEAGGIFALFLGENETKSQHYKIKNLETGNEYELSFQEIISLLEKQL